jgi:hypothetical protein
MMTANPIETHAAAERRAGPRRADAASPQARSRATASNRYTPPQRITPDFTGDEQAAHRGGDPGVLDTTGKGRQASVTDPSITQADPTGGGSGSGRSNDPSSPTPNRTQGTAARVENGNTIAGGVGASRDGAGGAGVSGQTAGHGDRQRPAPPWATQQWPSAQQGAEAALRDGRVPPEYHDLVRAYFDR